MSSTVPAVRRKRPAKPQFTQTILVLEAFVVLFATLVVHGLRTYPTGPVWAVGGGLVVLLLVASGWVGRPGGYVVGWVLQGWLLAASLLAPAGARDLTVITVVVFVALWAVALRLGGRIDRERAEYDAAHPADAAP
ncbi:DUF4233 domain-containing protein [Cellulomonas soli]|uniref:DUF4233 domain-containing protein n=1 Tax=Cellulomonas soli TaxID=931535 RepID=UPI0011BFDB69|nr:DUF4233 domain-containing protein [Cellulomonas soli]NYI61093.1 hypothetical protein [Cellulomonas soli]